METITAAAFAAKYKSKREIYVFLTVEAGAFLPSYDTVTIYFLKDLIGGVKQCKYLFIMTSFLQTSSAIRCSICSCPSMKC